LTTEYVVFDVSSSIDGDEGVLSELGSVVAVDDSRSREDELVFGCDDGDGESFPLDEILRGCMSPRLVSIDRTGERVEN